MIPLCTTVRTLLPKSPKPKPQMGVSEIRGTSFGVPIPRESSSLGVYLGVPYFAETPKSRAQP